MNIEDIDKWLDNEYGCSYTRLEELHDFVVEQDLKDRDEIERLKRTSNEIFKANETLTKEIERLHSIIKEVREYIEDNSTDKYLLKSFDIDVLLKILEKENK